MGRDKAESKEEPLEQREIKCVSVAVDCGCGRSGCRCNEKNRQVSAKKLKEVIKGKESTLFFEYAFKRLEKIKGSLSILTYRIMSATWGNSRNM